MERRELAAAKAQHVERQKQLCDVLYEKVRFREVEGEGPGLHGEVGQFRGGRWEGEEGNLPLQKLNMWRYKNNSVMCYMKRLDSGRVEGRGVACQNAELAAAKAQHVERQKQLCDVLYEKVGDNNLTLYM